jgi:FkbM family methyltransferase
MQIRRTLLYVGIALAMIGAISLLQAEVQRKSRPKSMETLLHTLGRQPSFSIVQIGAYIGDTENDPLFDFLHRRLGQKPNSTEIKVVLVEPIREYFDQLRQNYEGVGNLYFENVAIAEKEGEIEMFRLNADPVAHGFPEWLSQLSSLKKERMEELWDNYERHEEAKRFYLEHRVTEKVKAVTLQQLLDKHQIKQLDLLQIDAEGYDYEILKTIDFNNFRPRYINYERVLLQEDEPACREMLMAAGYELIDWGQDTLCILKE